VTSITPPPSAQRLTRLRVCQQCGEPIRSGTRRPRLFCDRPGCRKAASRARRKPAPKQFCDIEQAGLHRYRAPDSNARTTAPDSSKARKQRVAGHNIHGGIDNALAGRWPINLVGGRRSDTSIDPILIQKILAAELGVPYATVVSPDGITAKISPRNHSRTPAVTTHRRSGTAAMHGSGPESRRS
jgi:hypothetical protein